MRVTANVPTFPIAFELSRAARRRTPPTRTDLAFATCDPTPAAILEVALKIATGPLTGRKSKRTGRIADPLGAELFLVTREPAAAAVGAVAQRVMAPTAAIDAVGGTLGDTSPVAADLSRGAGESTGPAVCRVFRDIAA